VQHADPGEATEDGVLHAPSEGATTLRRQLWTTLAVLGLMAIAGAAEPDQGGRPIAADIILKAGTVVDGTGAPARKADVAIRGERIVAVGMFEPGPEAKVIDATGLIVAPGFIDLHTHSDEGITKTKTRANLNYQTQGVTTIVTGNCGGGALDVGKYLDAIDEHGAGTNVIHLIPHGTLRASVFGNAERPPTSAEMKRMKALVERGMKAGAWGMSTGLIYLPGRYADVHELIELSKVVARHGGIYASHIRNEESGLLRSIDEAIEIGRGAGLPVHISHLKASGRSSWGSVGPACERIDEVRKSGLTVTADQYPYIASSTKLAAMVVPHWAIQGTAEEFARIADDPERGPKLRQEIQNELDDRLGGAAIRVARYAPKPSRVGKDLVAIAREEGLTPVEVVIDVQRHGGAQAINFGMSEDDVRAVMRHDWVATASDGSTHVPNGQDQPHPRAYGTFPRKIRYAIDEKVITLEQAIRSCSGLPAEILHLPDRGVIRPGAFADLVVFDPATFRDAATFDHPTRYATGVEHLFVNGVAVIAEAKPQKKLPGRALRLVKDGPADLILKLGRIWTGDPDRPWAEALASRGGEIVAIGSADDVARFQGPHTRVVDRPGAFATPGLVDAHGHLTSLGKDTEQIDLRGVDRLDEVARRVKAWIDEHPGDSWVLGQNWDQSLWPGGAFPTAATLDAVAPARPVWLERVDGHAGWANSEALRRARITRESEAPSDGQILHDAQGEPTGVFIDGAKSLISRLIPPPTLADCTRQILAGQALALRAGLTGVHDAGVERLEAEAYRALDHEGRLKLRVYGMASLPEGHEVQFVSHPPIPARSGARFEMRAIKVFIDGAMGSRGGLLFEPYSDDPGNKGLLLIDPRTLEAATSEALRHGWQVATHAIGDRGNALVLDAYGAARKAVPEAKDPRLRIEHAQVVRKEDVARFAELGIIASMQPSHAIDDMRWADARLGPDRGQGAYAWRWFLDNGVRVAFGSDFPVEVVNPFYGIYAALTREDAKGEPRGGWHPDQRMSLDETLRAFTAGSAFAAFAEDHTGILKPGMRADVTVVDRDLFKVAPLEILRMGVLMTIVDGEVVYESTTP
jgi:predicted amidohydrolase YtcJ